jgi:mannitol-1-/sugar-/sorbitol-6-phosphatase
MNITNTIRAVLFDMDGVIIDSNSEIEKFWAKWAAKENLEYTDETTDNYIHGRTTIETINELFKKSSGEVKKQIFDAAIDFDLNMCPGLVKDADTFLKNLSAALHKITLVTSAPKERARKMLELNGVYKYFNAFVTGDEVKQGKPDPEPYLKAAAKMNLAPDRCLVFEDSKNGIISALTAGMYVVAVNNYEIENERIITSIKDYSMLKVSGKTIQIIDKLINIELVN